MKQHFSRFLASLLSVLILMQCFCMTAFADGAVDVIIPAGSDAAAVNQILTEALLGEDSETQEWEYYCNGVYNALISNDAWGSVQGFTSIKTVGTIITKEYTCNHPALADNDNGQYQVRVTGTTKEYTINKKAKSDSSIQLNNNASAALVYTDNSELDVDATEQAIINAVVASTEPEYLTADNVTIEYEATSTITTTAWMPLNGGTKNLVNYPAISSGVQKIRISWGGDEEYNGFSAETSVMMTDRAAANLVLKADQNVALTYKDGAVDYSALKNAIFAAVFDAESSIPSNLLAADVTIEYYYQGHTSLDSKWAPLKGGTVELVNCAGMTVGNGQKIRVSLNGSADYSAASAETTVNIVEGRSACTVVISGDKLNIKDKSVDDILDAIVKESTVALTSDNSSVEYYDEGGIGGYGAGWKKLESLSEGTFKIRVVFDGNDEYLPAVSNELEIRFVTKEDAEISLNDAPYSVAIPYNEASEIDFNALKTAIFHAVVDSVVPGDFTENNVTIEYYYNGITSVDSRWLPLEGQEIALGQGYPAISAGTHNIKFSWSGNDDYYGLEQEVTVTLSDRETAPYTLWDPIGKVKLTYNEDLSVNYDALRTDIFNAVIASSEVLTDKNVTIEYYYNGISSVDSKWLPLEGQEIVLGQGYPAMATPHNAIVTKM